MKAMGKLVAVVVLCVAAVFVVAPVASAAPCPVTNGQSTGLGAAEYSSVHR